MQWLFYFLAAGGLDEKELGPVVERLALEAVVAWLALCCLGAVIVAAATLLPAWVVIIAGVSLVGWLAWLEQRYAPCRKS